jgi:hypothetical protein
MNRDEIWKLAVECGGSEFNADDPWIAFWPDKLEAFASRIEAATREECAKECDKQVELQYETGANDDAINQAMPWDAIRKSEG